MPRLQDYIALSDAVYGPRPTEPIVVTVGSGPGSTQTWDFLFDSGNPSQPGYYGAAYQSRETGEIILANRGTQDRADVWTDLLMVLDIAPDQLDNAQDFYARVRAVALADDENNPRLFITGHSLGGSLTQLLVASHAGEEVNGFSVIGQTFNAYGVRHLLDNLGLPDVGYAVTNWRFPTDPVSTLAQHIGSTHTLADLPSPFTPYPLGPVGILLFPIDSHRITTILNGFTTTDTHPLIHETEEYLIKTFVTDFGFPITIDGPAYIGGNNRQNVGNQLTGGGLNDLMFGGRPDDRIHGGEGRDVIYGGSGDDTLWGDGGADFLLGEDDDDTYYVDDPDDQIIEAFDGGFDTVYTTVTFNLSILQQSSDGRRPAGWSKGEKSDEIPVNGLLAYA